MNSGLCGLIMLPVFTSTSGATAPDCLASANSRCFLRSDIDSVVCVGAADGSVDDMVPFVLDFYFLWTVLYCFFIRIY